MLNLVFVIELKRALTPILLGCPLRKRCTGLLPPVTVVMASETLPVGRSSTITTAQITVKATTRISEMLGHFLHLNKMKIKRLSNHMSQYFINNRT